MNLNKLRHYYVLVVTYVFWHAQVPEIRKEKWMNDRHMTPDCFCNRLALKGHFSNFSQSHLLFHLYFGHNAEGRYNVVQQQCKVHYILLCERLEETFSLVLECWCLVFSSCCICCTLSALPLKRSVKAGKTWPSKWVPPTCLGTPTCKFVILSLTFHYLSIVCKLKIFAYSKNQENAQLLQINNPVPSVVVAWR